MVERCSPSGCAGDAGSVRSGQQSRRPDAAEAGGADGPQSQSHTGERDVSRSCQSEDEFFLVFLFCGIIFFYCTINIIEVMIICREQKLN